MMMMMMISIKLSTDKLLSLLILLFSSPPPLYPHSSGFGALGPGLIKNKKGHVNIKHTFNAQDKMECSLSDFLRGNTVKGISLFRND